MSRLWRRTRFATPFVVIAGCSGSGTRVAPPPEPPAGDTRPRAAEPRPAPPADPDPGGGEPTTAAPIVPGIAGTPGPYDGPCDGPPAPGNPTCNPPAQYVIGKIVARERVAEGLRITIARGTNDRVARSWKGELIDDAGRPIANTRFTISKLTHDTAVAVVKDLAELPSHRARLSP